MEVLHALTTMNEVDDGDQTHSHEANDDRSTDTFHNRNIFWEEGKTISFKDVVTTTGSETASRSANADHENINIDDIFRIE